MSEKQVYNLKIDTELRDLLPPLTHDEFKQLEDNLVKDGCQNPLFVWRGFIADGHNRYIICQKHKIPFAIAELGFDDKSEVMRWMIDGQLGRRNLSPIQRVAVTEKYRPVFEEKAKENQGTRNDLNIPPNSEASDIKIRNRDNETERQLAKLANVGHTAYHQAKTILDSDNEEVKQKVLSGDMSINAGYNVIKPKKEVENHNVHTQVHEDSKIENKPILKEPKTRKCLKCKQEKLISEFAENSDFCNECMKHINAPVIDNSYIDTSTEVGKVIKDLKTPKVAADYIIVKDELLSIKNSIQEMIEAANERIFDRYNLPNKMTQEDKDNAIIYMNQLSGEILKLKNKIEKIKIKGEN